METPIARGARVTLRPHRPDDRDALFDTMSDPEVMAYWSTGPWTDPARADEMLSRDLQLAAAGEALRWAIEHQGRYVGFVSLHHFDRQNRRCEVGYLLNRSAWGQGLAREGVTLGLDCAFGPLGLHRVEADTDPRNTASITLLERLGFTREGTLRERWWVDGVSSDTALFGLLAPEWARRRV
ncbi:MAG: GNAT family N-acetyltransferase [Myxococcota bacterium]